MAALRSQQRRDLAAFPNLVGFGARSGHLQAFVSCDHTLDKLDLADRLFIGIGDVGGDVDRPELRSDTTLEHSGNVGVVALEVLAGVQVGVGRPECPRQVVVPVYDGKRSMDLLGLLRVCAGQLWAYLVTPSPYFSSKRRATSPSSAWRPVSCFE